MSDEPDPGAVGRPGPLDAMRRWDLGGWGGTRPAAPPSAETRLALRMKEAAQSMAPARPVPAPSPKPGGCKEILQSEGGKSNGFNRGAIQETGPEIK